MSGNRVIMGLWWACVILSPVCQAAESVQQTQASEQTDFFERKIRPVLIEHCYKCHSAGSSELKGGLRLDLRAGWQAGGDSGQPAVMPGKPDESPLIRAVRHDSPDEAMPPNQPRLSDAIVSDLIRWVAMGAPDPRDGQIGPARTAADWNTLYHERLNWWSLRPVASVEPPAVGNEAWLRNDVDRFILAELESHGLRPAAEADRRTLARRLSFALIGLPPKPEVVERFAADESPEAWDLLVESLLSSPHFGERWARHWLDVVHYSDTHGYEWDTPTKNSWMYRDYVVRSLNSDLSIRRFFLEQLAGDLIEPRIDPRTGVNESLIGPMALRLGERRHGDNADAEGITQEAMANIIDTVGKGFLGTTVACAQCHDHKLDAVPQKDYYALAGIFMSTRWGVRSLDAVDPNVTTIAELRRIKQAIRAEIAASWQGSRTAIIEKIRAIPVDEKAAAAFPESLAAFWHRSRQTGISRDEFVSENQRRKTHNADNLKLLADFSREGAEGGWRWDGLGMQHGLARDGEFVVADEGDTAIAQILPGGRWSHLWSMRLAGALRSPLLDASPPLTFSIGFAAGHFVGQSFILDQAFHSERMSFLNHPAVGWLTQTAANFSTLEGTPDQAQRRVYFELVTKALNNYFPPRSGFGGVTDAVADDPRSWFGVTRVWQHPAGKAPVEELDRFLPLFEAVRDPAASDPAAGAAGDWAERLADLVLTAAARWGQDDCDADVVRLLTEALDAKLLANDLQQSPELARLVAEYRATEKKLQPDRTIGSMADWNEARNERIGIRGSYTDFGEEVPRGNLSLLGGPADLAGSSASGRLEFAESVVSDRNPLTARVFVNRVWQHLYGTGLVRTPDDFGHLGERPSHPALLDYLADRFMRDGWSLKQLIRRLVSTAAWRQDSVVAAAAAQVDPENRLLHHLPMRRLEAEGIRDAMLFVSGRLDRTISGPPINPYRTAQDAAKRLFSGPLDGDGRRSLYTKMTLMEPPRLMALFNQPIPKLTTGRRDVTNVPDQALALLNDPFVIAMAKRWSETVLPDGEVSAENRLNRMFQAAFSRPPRTDETARLMTLLTRAAELRGADTNSLMTCQPAWQDVAHAIFNLKEFIYVR